MEARSSIDRVKLTPYLKLPADANLADRPLVVEAVRVYQTLAVPDDSVARIVQCPGPLPAAPTDGDLRPESLGQRRRKCAAPLTGHVATRQDTQQNAATSVATRGRS